MSPSPSKSELTQVAQQVPARHAEYVSILLFAKSWALVQYGRLVSLAGRER